MKNARESLLGLLRNYKTEAGDITAETADTAGDAGGRGGDAGHGFIDDSVNETAFVGAPDPSAGPGASGKVLAPKILGAPVIAVCGVSRGVGCTHASLLIARFLKRLGHSVAIDELNPNGAIERLAYNENIARRGNLDRIQYKGVAIHSGEKIGSIINYGYDYIVLDIGSLLKNDHLYEKPVQPIAADAVGDINIVNRSEYIIDEINRANLRILLSGASQWNITSLADILNTEEKPEKKWQIVFTNVPGSKIGKMAELMEGYRYQFLPVMDIDDASYDGMLYELLRPVLPGETARRRGVKLLRKTGRAK